MGDTAIFYLSTRQIRSGVAKQLATTLAVAAIVSGATALRAEDAAVVFRKNCISCHTIGGGRLVGPDLKDVEQRKDRAWLESFIFNPKAKLDAGDPYVMKLKEEARGAIMPPIADLTPADARALVDLIAAESKLEKSQFAGLNIGDQPFTQADIQAGHEIFVGKRALTNGGPACVSCHDASGIPLLGGGRLGPDLTRVYERMQGRKNLATWLQAPATPTMRPLFLENSMTNEEIVPIVAFLEDEARHGKPVDSSPRLAFFFLGFGGAIAALLGADVIWRKRLRGVRRRLTRGEP